MTKELELLKSAAFEINGLRRRNELMGARLEMFDNVMLVLKTEPRGASQGMSPDILREIENFIHTNKNTNEESKTN